MHHLRAGGHRVGDICPFAGFLKVRQCAVEHLVGRIEEVIRQQGKAILEKVKLFDVYRGKQVEEGKKSVAFALTYRDKDKTLTDEEVAEVHNNVLDALKEKLNAVLREL